jgi:hypothetical protein
MAIAVASVLPFLPAVHGDFVWDDHDLLVNNVYLQRPDYWRHALSGDFFDVTPGRYVEHAANRQIYRPFVSLAYGLEYRLWGFDSFRFHLVNLLLHAACAALVFAWLLRRLAGATVPAVIGALAFALHPSRTESVAWISGCTDLWMTLWVLIGLYLWDRSRSVSGAAGAGIAFSLAFFCKEIAIVVPVTLALDAWLRGSGDLRVTWLRLATASGVVALALGVRLAHVGTNANGGLTDGARAITTRVVGTLGGYVRLLVWPWPVSTQVGYLASANTGGPMQLPTPSLVVGGAVLVGLGALALRLRSTPALRPWLADASWLAVPLLPVLNIIPVTAVTYVNERHAYLAGLGLAALLARAASTAAPLAVAAAALLIPYSVGAGTDAAHFVSDDALWTYERRLHPDDALALTNLYQIRFGEGRLDEAMELAAHLEAVMPRPEDRANAFNLWLNAKLRRATAENDTKVAEVRAVFDRIASHRDPPGEAASLYETITEAGRVWLRRSPAFRVRRAYTAILLGDFASARRQLEAVEHDAGPNVGARRPLVVALIAAGAFESAELRLNAPAPPGTEGETSALRRLLAQVRALETTTAASPNAVAQKAWAFMDVREAAVAHALAAQGLASSPDSAALLEVAVRADIGLERSREVGAELQRLRQVDPGAASKLEH